jgi:Tfp pilus assembly protein PilP
MPTAVLLILAFGAGQTPAPSPPAEKVPAPSAYTYNPQGRRDPFVSLANRGEAKEGGTHGDGIAGLSVQEVTVKGIIQGRGGSMAMVHGLDNKTYIVRPGDKLFDGVVKAITQDGVTFSQDVNDPLSPVKQREIQKRIRTGGGRG